MQQNSMFSPTTQARLIEFIPKDSQGCPPQTPTLCLFPCYLHPACYMALANHSPLWACYLCTQCTKICSDYYKALELSPGSLNSLTIPGCFRNGIYRILMRNHRRPCSYMVRLYFQISQIHRYLGLGFEHIFWGQTQFNPQQMVFLNSYYE